MSHRIASALGPGGALTSTLHWFETDLLTRAENLVGLTAVNRELLARAARATRADRVVLDMDSSESPVHGAQEGTAYNGHFATVCYHPLFLFNDQGDCLAASLRPGNVPSADDWDDLLVPEIDRQQAAGRRVAFRADAAFARPAIYEGLEHRDVAYAIRMPANKNLELAVEEILFRPPGRPTGDPLDAAVVPSVPGERGAPATERPGVQPGQPLAQTGPAAADQTLVAHESPAAAGENRRPAGEARQVLLAPAGGRASDPAAVRRHAAADLGAAGAGRLTRHAQRSPPGEEGTHVGSGVCGTP